MEKIGKRQDDLNNLLQGLRDKTNELVKTEAESEKNAVFIAVEKLKTPELMRSFFNVTYSLPKYRF